MYEMMLLNTMWGYLGGRARVEYPPFITTGSFSTIPNGLSFLLDPITQHVYKHSCDLGLEERPIVKIYGPLKLAHHQLLCALLHGLHAYCKS